MKKQIRFLGGWTAFLGAFVLLIGCTSSPTSRSSGEYFDDQAVNARVKAALLADDDVSGMDVSTTTFDGVVQLSGFVDTPAQKYRAEKVAEEVSGVESVVNNISISPRDTEFGGRKTEEMKSSSEPPVRDSDTQKPRPNDEDLREYRPLN